MKKVQTTLFLITLLILGCVVQVAAQSRKQENTASARAAYGAPPSQSSYKVKQKVKRKKNSGYTNHKKARNKREGKKGRRPRAIL